MELHSNGVSAYRIAKRLGVSYGLVYGLTRAGERGFQSPREYRQYLVQRRGFVDEKDYRGYLAERQGLEGDVEYRLYLARRRGFSTYSAYLRHLEDRRMGTSTNREISSMVRDLLKEQGKTQTWLAQQLGISRQAVSRYACGRGVPRCHFSPG